MSEATSKRKLIDAARVRFAQQLAPMLPALHQAILERLQTRCEQIGTQREMQQRRDDRVNFEQRSQAWQSATLAAWRERAGAVLQGRQADPVAGLALTLEDTDTADDLVVAAALSGLVQVHVAAELELLRIRVKIGESPTPPSRHDILWPDALLALMVQQWRQTGLPNSLWSPLQPILQEPVQTHLNAAYADVNRFLAEHGLLPHGDRRKNGPRIVGVPRRQGDPSDTDRSASRGRPELPAAATPPVTHQAHDERQFDRHFDVQAGMPVPPRAGPALAAAAQSPSVALQQVLSQWGLDMQQSVPLSPALALALAVGTPRFPASGDEAIDLAQALALLRNQSAALRQAAISTNEKAIVELVALMFHSILHQERIPPRLRLLFARLQIPVLRVAMAEPAFFATNDHPARQLIDRIGACLLEVRADTRELDALERKGRHVVDEIERCHQNEPGVFGRMRDEWQAFLVGFLIEKDVPARTTDLAQLIESVQTLSTPYRHELTQTLRGVPLHDTIEQFLLQVWSKVLAHAAVKLGPGHRQTLAFKGAVTILVWASGAKSSTTEQERMIKCLPILLTRLREGMGLMGLTTKLTDAHIGRLTSALTDAFMMRTEPIDRTHIEALTQRLAGFEKLFNADGITEMLLDEETIHLILEVDVNTVTVLADDKSTASESALAGLPELSLGSWFELDHNAQLDRVQLSWRSPRQHLYLLVSASDHSYLFQSRRLASYLETSLLLPLENEGLTARATREALAKLMANPERVQA